MVSSYLSVSHIAKGSQSMIKITNKFSGNPTGIAQEDVFFFYGFAWVDPGESDIYLKIPIHIHIPYISIPNSIYVSTGNRIYSIIFYVFLYLIIPTAAPIFIYI